MASGRPVIAAVNGGSQAASLVRAADGGLVIEPENATALAAAVLNLATRPQDCAAMGARNRAFAEQHFDRLRIVREQQALIEEVVGVARTPRPSPDAESSAHVKG
jgi:glycosyltransferase involved in cell wall biosynthesis